MLKEERLNRGNKGQATYTEGRVASESRDRLVTVTLLLLRAGGRCGVTTATVSFKHRFEFL